MAEITQFLLDENDNILTYKTTKEVVTFAGGSSAHIILPIKLLGKKVTIQLIESQGGKNQNDRTNKH